MPKYQFKEIETYSTRHVVEADSLHEAIGKYEEMRENFEARGEGVYEGSEYRGPVPICESCGTAPTIGFAIACCRQPNFPHSKQERKMMYEIAKEEE